MSYLNGLNHSAFRDATASPGALLALTPKLSMGSSGRVDPARAGEPAGLVLQIVGDLAAVSQDWRTFEATAHLTPFQAFGRLSKWQAHIGVRRGTRPVVVVGKDRSGDILFILPLAVERTGPLQRLTWLGGDLSDYNAPLLRADFFTHCPAGEFRPLWARILRAIRAEPQFRRLDLVDLAKMPAQVDGLDNPFLELPSSLNPSHAYLAHLGPDWAGYYAVKRSAATRKRERRQLRQLTDLGEVEFFRVEDGPDVETTVAALFDQKGRSLARRGATNIFARPGYCEFYLDMAGDPDTRGSIHLSKLTVGSTLSAVGFGLVFRSCFYLVMSSYDDGPASRFGPGRAHLHALLAHAIENGFAAFDFTIGDEPYKQDWADVVAQLSDHAAAVSLQGVLASASLRGARKAKRAIKQNPYLWRAFSRLRLLSSAARPARAGVTPGEKTPASDEA